MGIGNDINGDIPILPSDELPNPFGIQACAGLSESELRETAYEVLVGACRSTGGKPLTYISQSQRAGGIERVMSMSAAPSLQRSLSSMAVSKVKKALGLKPSKKSANLESSTTGKRPMTVGELIRVQMRVSEQTDSRIRRGLLRIAAGQFSEG
ncbi:hypothetical protein U1Q18_028628 [Sarracenia purpurea var. burkii]